MTSWPVIFSRVSARSSNFGITPATNPHWEHWTTRIGISLLVGVIVVVLNEGCLQSDIVFLCLFFEMWLETILTGGVSPAHQINVG